MSAHLFDQPGKLYLGREFDLGRNQPTEAPLLLNARDLTTHAVCLGMTGTGKTGLGICLLEEVLLQDVPCIILDPKGDITNLVLAFPDLAPADFRPWVDEDEAHRHGQTVDQLAEQTAQRWKAGLASWGIEPERVRQLHDRVAFNIYTPGSNTGIPVNILQNFNPPTEGKLTWAQNAETLRERIAQIVSALLDLVGFDGDRADPVKSREHILLSTLFESAWRAGQPVNIAALIQMIQTPPIRKVGAFDMDVFYPKAERFELAMALNNLSASPSFQSWQNGISLDIADLMKRVREPERQPGSVNPAGKVQASIFYLAHLSDEERQFFITLLLSQVVLWMRAQSGTSSLRALVYFDEVFGYCPPFPRNPPTKQPIMTIIKQGRAAGLGLFLATQNPADLDYKGLANIGTWFIGRLRTGRDRDRALEGLEGAAAGLNRAEFEKPLSTLPQRVFLAQSATGDPRFFQTRWAMSYLRGPMTRDQVAALKGEAQGEGGRGNENAANESAGLDGLEAPTAAWMTNTPTAPINPNRATHEMIAPRPTHTLARPQLPPDVREVFLETEDGGRRTAFHASVARPSSIVYVPRLLASASVRITDRTSGVIQDERYTYLLPLAGVLQSPDFTRAQSLPTFDPQSLKLEPAQQAHFEPLPAGLTGRWMKQAEKVLIEFVYRNGVKSIFFNRALKVYGDVGESGLVFRQRCEAAAGEKRNQDALKIRAQFEKRMVTLQNQLMRENRELESDRSELTARKREELLTNAESVLNFMLGRRSNRSVSWGANKRRQTQASEMEVHEGEQAIAKLNSDLQHVAGEYQAALSQISEKWMHAVSDVVEMPLAPKKGDIFADLVALAWVPVMLPATP